ncbi:MAG: DUF58 domain-containing protein [Oscillospiraceae bacterium]|nr:DUF58 domain-containing protein [Oscillospiraceae bacterium]
MIRAKLLYAALVVVMVLFFVLYRGNLSFELLIFTLVFPLIPLISVAVLKHFIKAGIYHSREPIRKGELFQWILQISNRSFFSSANAQIMLEYRNSLTGEERELTLMVPVVSHNTQRLRLGFHAVTCGVMQITVKKLVLYDALRLFRRTVRLNLTDTVVIMPAPNVLLPEQWPPKPQPDADTNEYSKEKAGDDPSEIFDLHQYREGDPVSRIHWKLSSKIDALMVKEYSLPLSAGCLLLPDYRMISKEPEAALRADAMLSAVAAAAAQLSERGGGFSITGYHAKSGMVSSEPFSSMNDMAEWMRQIVKYKPIAPDGRPAQLQAMQEFLSTEALAFARVMIFTPRLDAPLRELLLSQPEPDRFAVFAVIGQDEQSFPDQLGGLISCVPIRIPQPIHPSTEQLRAMKEPDFEKEILIKGGAAL